MRMQTVSWADKHQKLMDDLDRIAEVHVPLTDDLITDAVRFLAKENRRITKRAVSNVLRAWAKIGMYECAIRAKKLEVSDVQR